MNRAGRWAGVALLLLVAVVPAAAQHSETQYIASSLADEIARAGRKSVMVMDFIGPSQAFTRLGRVLALECTASLNWAERDLDAYHSVALNRALSERTQWADPLADPSLMARAREFGGADAFVVGTIEVSDGSVRLRLTALDGQSLDSIGRAEGGIPRTRAVYNMLNQPLLRVLSPVAQGAAAAPPQAGPQVFRPGAGGVGFPQCIACPNPSYTQSAREAKISGSVLLSIIVAAEGTVGQVEVVRGLGFGLDEAAINAVRGWKFRPAIGPGGTPVAVRTQVEVTFKLL